MMLHHDAPIEVDLDELAVTPNRRRAEATVRLPRVPDPRRASRRGAVGDGRVGRPRAGRRASRARRRGDDRGVGGAGGRGDRRRRRRSTSPPRGSASPAGAPLAGIAVVVDPAMADVLWIPADVLADDAVRAALGAHADLRGHNVKPLMRSLLEFDVEVARSHARHRDRRVPDRSGRGALHAARPHREVHEVRPAVRRRRRQRPARPRRHLARRRRTRRSRCARRQRACRTDRREPGGPGDGRAVPHDREPARAGARQDGARRRRRRRRRTASARHSGCPTRCRRCRGNCERSPAATTSTSTRPSSCARSSTTSVAWRRARRPRPASPPTRRRSRRSRTSGPSSSNR